MKLTEEWQPYNGDYEKRFHDVRLKDGTEVPSCWPNAGVFTTVKCDAKFKPIHPPISEADITHVRLSEIEY